VRITRLLLRNYRVYEKELELEMPAGLVGVYGPNGAGKSALLESILWTMWGKARTGKDEIRTAGSNTECISEVDFEHEGHLYSVRRTIAGQSATVRAEAFADGLQVAEGARDTVRYVHSVLGIEDTAFRASVFAEQGQVASFSANPPAERRRLVLGLLGVTPLDGARDQARRDAREQSERLEQLRGLLQDVGQLEAELESARRECSEAEDRARRCRDEEARLGAELEAAEARARELARSEAAYKELVAEGKGKADLLLAARERVEKLAGELEELGSLEARLAAVVPLAEGLSALEPLVALAREAERSREAVAAIVVPPEPPLPEVEVAERAALGARELSNRLAEVEGERSAIAAQQVRAAEAVERAAGLSDEEECPLCGQQLGRSFEQVRRHRATELAEANSRLEQLEAQAAELAQQAERAARRESEAHRALERQQAARSDYEAACARRAEAEELARGATGSFSLAAGEAQLSGLRLPDGRSPLEASAAELGAEVERRRGAEQDAAVLRARLERRRAVESDLEAGRLRVEELSAQVDALRDKVRGLGFRPEEVELAERALESARAAAREAAERARRVEQQTAVARETVSKLAGRLEVARAEHQRAAELGEDARHLSRVAELIGAFRNSVVATIGPRLSAQAADLFAELTDHEYDRLEVDPETYELQIRDDGPVYGMDRFSGSETDLANLALRVAISEQIRFQSGGAVGLLVLDEVFGPLDDERRERMLVALDRLRARFRQVLVVTHNSDIKEQLPNAIEVVKLPGRRARARVL
jgi:DNA repair exonuclease SbcCD ATPase subunit